MTRAALHALVTGCLLGAMTACRGSTSGDAEADILRSTERDRVRALVAADTAAAGPLHAPDFQLINPLGGHLSRSEYLGGVAAGQIDYRTWEPDSMTVRVHGDVGLVRYRSRLEVEVGGQVIPLQRYWHTDAYEKREGRWQVVWSHATLIQSPPPMGGASPPPP